MYHMAFAGQRLRHVYVVAATIACAAFAGAANDAQPSTTEEKRRIIQADPKIQLQIEQTVQALATIDHERHEGIDEAFQEIDELTDMTNGPTENLVRQLILYQANAETMKQGMMPFFIFKFGEIPEGTIARALAPFIFVDDERLRAKVRERLHAIEHAATGRPPDYSHYIHLISRNTDDPPRPLIKYMLLREPMEALAALRTAYREVMTLEEQKSVLWAEHVIENALWFAKHARRYDFPGTAEAYEQAFEQMEALAKSKRWWLRLFVAELMHRHRSLRRDDLIAKLKDDADEAVRHAIEEALKPTF